MRIVVTGASGFVGGHLVPALADMGHEAVPLSRAALAEPEARLRGADALVHLAGIAHARGRPAADYAAVNRDLAIELAERARECGIRRFVFLSSTHAETHRHTPYGASKAEAEEALLALSGMEMVILRPTLVYGRGVKGNFRLLLRLAALPLPLPLGAAQNRRSLVAVGNLVDAIGFVLTHREAAGRIFTVTDPGSPPTVAEIVTRLRAGMGRKPGLFPAPWLPGLLRAVGMGGLADRLFGESVVDGGPLFALGWKPPLEPTKELERCGHGRRGPPQSGGRGGA